MNRIRFVPVAHGDDPSFVKDVETGTVWHKVFNRVLYADTDRAKVVYHANYLRYFEMGRAGLLRDLGRTYREIEDQGFIHPIINLEVTYHKPLEYDDPMWIYTRPSALERVKLTFDYRIMHAETNQLVVSGSTTHACINRNGVPTEMDPITVEMCKKMGLSRT